MSEVPPRVVPEIVPEGGPEVVTGAPEVGTGGGAELPRELDPQGALANPEDLPVVARMVVEIRSDGIKTVARGAFEDFQTGQQVAVETDPLAAAKLAQAFTKSILGSTAGLVRLGVSEGLKTSAKSLVPDPLRRLKRKLFGQEPPAED